MWIKRIIYDNFPTAKGETAMRELFDFLKKGGIEFFIKEVQDEFGVYFFAESTNVSKKCIIATGQTLEELDREIKEAILAAFHIPKYYDKQIQLRSNLPAEQKLIYATA